MKRQFFQLVFLLELRNVVLPCQGSLFYKQETDKQEVKGGSRGQGEVYQSIPKVVQEAKVKLDGGWKAGFQALSLHMKKSLAKKGKGTCPAVWTRPHRRCLPQHFNNRWSSDSLQMLFLPPPNL